MTTDNFQVIVELQTQEFSGSSYPVIMVTLPASMASSLEIFTYNPKHMSVHPNDEGGLSLHVGGQHIAELDDRNGSFDAFKKLLDSEHMFALTLTACSESRDGTLYILARTLMAENITGRVVSNSGPQKIRYDEAIQDGPDSPESYFSGRSFRTAVELAVAMRNEDEEPHLRLVN